MKHTNRETATGAVLILCLSLSLQLLELTQTRILSVLYFASSAYWINAIATMAFGTATACFAMLIKRWKNAQPSVVVPACIFSLTSIIAVWITSSLPLLFPQHGDLTSICMASAVLAVPFISAGAATSSILSHGCTNVPVVFFCFFTGRAVGAAVFSSLLRFMGPSMLLCLSSAMVIAGCGLYTARSGFSARIAGFSAACFAGAAVMGNAGIIQDTVANFKYEHVLRRNATKEHSTWTPVGKIDIWSTNDPFRKVISVDGGVSSWSLLAGADAECGAAITLSPASLPYIIKPAPAEVLLISPAGGEEIVRAQSYGAHHVTGVEMNSGLYNLIQTRYANFAKWAGSKNATIYNENGRAFLEKSASRYDIISINFDTLTALSAGPYLSAENYLYTVNALQSYLRQLCPDGILFFCRLLCNPPREGLRIANQYLYAAEAEGIRNPSQCMLVICWYFHPTTWAATLLKKEPFSAAEVAAILRAVKSRPDLAAVYIPDVFPPDRQKNIEAEAFAYQADDLSAVRTSYRELIAAGGHARRPEFEETYDYNIAPAYDDTPFFFECHKVREMFSKGEIFHWWSRGTIVHYVLFSLCALTLFLVVFCAVLPRGLYGLAGRDLLPAAFFFSSLGAGFSLICISLMQHLSIYLGYEEAALKIVLPVLYLFTGVGCLYAGSQSSSRSPQRALVHEGLGMTALTFLWFLFPWALSLPEWLHGALAAMAIVPLGLLLGSVLLMGYENCSEGESAGWAFGMYSLAWAGGAAACVTVAMRFGFGCTLLAGCAVYCFCAPIAAQKR